MRGLARDTCPHAMEFCFHRGLFLQRRWGVGNSPGWFLGLGRQRGGLATPSPFSSTWRPMVVLPNDPPTEAKGVEWSPCTLAVLSNPKGKLETQRYGMVVMGVETWLGSGEKLSWGQGGSFIGLGVRAGEVQCPESNPISNLSFNRISN
jgi:hypothetical protein